MKKTIAFFALLLISCQKEAQEVEYKRAFKLELLFEKDGCKMYRFFDDRTVYWSDCRGRVNYEYNTGTTKVPNRKEVEVIIDGDSNTVDYSNN